jgi:thiamine-phosphate pyrophosphorylase
MQHKKIYALCDFGLLQSKNLTLSQYLEIIHTFPNIVLIQYRDKINNLNIQKKHLLYLKQHTNIPIIINDNLNLVKYCDGIHLGQEDILQYLNKLNLTKKDFFDWFKKQYPTKIIGISTHNKSEILEANSFNIDYIGLGAYKNTSTKKDISGILGKKVEKLALLSNHKVAVIGGVKLDDEIKNINYYVIGSGLL